eukprot:Skav234228  [mRNA]  locus=scaffold1464:247723:254034:+ [translate_table: standard]
MGHGHSSELHPLNILSFCDWPHRGICTQLSPSLRSSLEDGGQGYWHFLCERLAAEHDIYVPSFLRNAEDTSGNTCPVARDWRELFFELYAIKDAEKRSRLKQPEQEKIATSVAPLKDFKIGVAARFRPSLNISNVMDDEDGVVLPLHQKVHLVRKQLGCTSKEAVSLIMRKQQRLKTGQNAESFGDSIFQPCLSPGYSNKENRESNNALIEPIEKNVELQLAVSAVLMLSLLFVLAVTKNSGLHDFAFDSVFGERSSQPQVYERAARRLVMEFLNGTSASIICYGQTASGKTHTMTCAEVLEAVDHWRQRGLEVRLSASYVELFGSEVSDLLREGHVVGQNREGRYSAVRATDRVGHRYVLDGHTEWHIQSLEDRVIAGATGIKLGQLGPAAIPAWGSNTKTAEEHVGTTWGIDAVKSTDAEKTVERRSRFYFADLGGSEQLSKSKVDAATRAKVSVVGGEEQSRLALIVRTCLALERRPAVGFLCCAILQEYNLHRQRVYETLNINKGLFSLKRVIEALHQRCRMAQEGVPTRALPYVPYQDSKLTMLLQEALGGSARTLILTTVTMDPAHAEESLQTLRFAETCAQVQKRREADQAASITLALDKIEQEIQSLQADIARKERWETRYVRRQDRDTIAGAFGEGTMVDRVEVVRDTFAVGAEAEREQLESLLERQAELKGLCSMMDFGKDYRSMTLEATKGASDGGRGQDSRASHFSARTKAKDFEDEAVLADALRFLFRSCKDAETVFGEFNARTRLQRNQIPEGYYKAARAMRERFEDQVERGEEQRLFGKAMLDRCTAWRTAFKQDASSKDAELSKLIQECGLCEA